MVDVSNCFGFQWTGTGDTHMNVVVNWIFHRSVLMIGGASGILEAEHAFLDS